MMSSQTFFLFFLKKLVKYLLVSENLYIFAALFQQKYWRSRHRHPGNRMPKHDRRDQNLVQNVPQDRFLERIYPANGISITSSDQDFSCAFVNDQFHWGCDMGEFWSSTIIDKNQNILSKKPFWFFVLNSYPQFLFIATPIL